MSGRTVVLTGAGRGIGRAAALALGSEGARLLLVGRRGAPLEETAALARSAGASEAVPVSADLATETGRAAVVAAVEEVFDGRLDVLVNNAGVFEPLAFEDLTAEALERTLAINLTAPVLLTRALLDALLASATGGGAPAVVNVASVAALRAFPGNVTYCASKYGLRGASDALREDLGPRGIAVRTVYPKATDTPIFDGLEGDWDRSTMDDPAEVAALIARATGREAPDELRMPGV